MKKFTLRVEKDRYVQGQTGVEGTLDEVQFSGFYRPDGSGGVNYTPGASEEATNLLHRVLTALQAE